MSEQSHDSVHGQSPPATRLEAYSRRASLPLNLMAVLFLFNFLLNFAYDGRDSDALRSLDFVSWLVWAVFAADYLIRVWLSPDRWAYIKSHKLDLLMVAVPMLRLLRAVIILRRGVGALRNDQIAGSFLFFVATVMFLGAALVLRVESHSPDANITSFSDALWWTAVTTTTVGYGDFYPVTTLGRLIAFGVMLLGISLIGTVSASAAAWLIKRRQPEAAQAEKEYTIADVMARLDVLAAEQERLRALLPGTPAERTVAGLNRNDLN